METIKFSNFKGFGGEHSIDVAPLTLIYGENSAGKSSLLELLRLAWTKGSCDTLRADHVEEPDGALALAHRRLPGKRIGISRRGVEMGWTFVEPLTLSVAIEWAYGPVDTDSGMHAFVPWKIEYETAYGNVTGQRSAHPHPEELDGFTEPVAFLLNRVEVRRFLESAIEANSHATVEGFETHFGHDFAGFWGAFSNYRGGVGARSEMTALDLLNEVRPALRSSSTNIWVDDGWFYVEGKFDLWTSMAIELLLKLHLESAGPDYLKNRAVAMAEGHPMVGIGYAVQIPAIRPPIPDRVAKAAVSHLEPSDPENYLNWIINNIEDGRLGRTRDSFGTADRVYKGGIREFNAALERLEIPHILRLRTIRSAASEVPGLDVWFEDRRSGALARPGGVGSGVAQVLPVIAACEFRRNDTLVTIEQPELHLHPRLQANLGEYFVEATEGYQEAPLIVETHSELLILRVLRMIREGTADPSKVAVHYVGNTVEGPQISQVRIGSDGEFIDEWPAGFFEERLDELF